VATYLERHAHHAADSLGAGAHAGITFRHFGTTVRAGSSSARAQRCDDAEVRVQEGPCISAMQSMRAIVLPDVDDEALYAAGPRTWTPADLRTAARAADAIASEVRGRMRLATGLVAERSAGPVRRDRDRLDLALGIVMETRGCDAATAERTLHALAARSGTDPAQLTDWLVAAGALPQASRNGHRADLPRG
jgi:hypothetical protein